MIRNAKRLVHDLAPVISKQDPGGAAPAASVAASSRASSVSMDLRRLTHRTIKKVTDDIEHEFQFNTAIAALMEFVNGLYKFAAETKGTDRPGEIPALQEAVNVLLVLLTPFAPHIAEQLWEETGHATTLARQPWPRYEEALLREAVLTIPIQVNGKLRSKVTVPADWSERQIVDTAKADAKVVEWIKGKAIKNVVYVEKRLVNIVVGDT